MGDAGEGLIDAESRIQERMEELERERSGDARRRRVTNPAELRARESLASLKLARTELARQLDATANERRRTQIADAMSEVDRRMAEVSALIPV
jgi:hypothetical protein